MGDSYREILVKRITPPADKIKKAALIGVTVVCFAGGLLVTPLLLLAGILLAVACYFLIPRFDLEFEYLYVNGELDVDKIMSRQKRKRCASYNMDKLELLAPSNSHSLDPYRNRKELPVRDFTSLNPDTPSFTMVINGEKGQELVKLEIDEGVVNDIRRIAPRKVCQY